MTTQCNIYTIFVQSKMLPEDVVGYICTFFSMQDYVQWVQSHRAATSKRAWGKRCFEFARARVSAPRLRRTRCHACSRQTCVYYTPSKCASSSLYCNKHSLAHLRVSCVVELLSHGQTSRWPANLFGRPFLQRAHDTPGNAETQTVHIGTASPRDILGSS